MAIAEFIAEHYDSMAELVWDLGGERAFARFWVDDTRVEVAFEERKPSEYLVSFETDKRPAIHRAFAVFNGVFQAAEEFITVREPDVVVFATKEPDLAKVYELYLNRERTRIADLGYRLLEAQRVEPLTEYILQRTTSSGWNRFT